MDCQSVSQMGRDRQAECTERADGPTRSPALGDVKPFKQRSLQTQADKIDETAG